MKPRVQVGSVASTTMATKVHEFKINSDPFSGYSGEFICMEKVMEMSLLSSIKSEIDGC